MLDAEADRRIAVQDPIKLIIDNYPEDQIEEFESPNHPQHPERGSRKLSFGKELWIERSDFAEEPPKGYRRLTLATADKPAMPVRLRHAYVVQATSVEKMPTARSLPFTLNISRKLRVVPTAPTQSKPRQPFTG